ncbi:ABC transporter permease [Nocardioides sp. LHG3406-4]|uniref:ABC transporter permease n=1 Tax=Nocardioides sp. LHG3406-4 TaxID=2804575 RepID=UPI003CFA0390
MTARVLLGLAQSNALLMGRNMLTVVYAVVVPLAPLALLVAIGERTGEAGAIPVSLCLLMALLFPVYYNLLSMFVTRRDELVLKRLRSGEATDAEIVVSMALPGVALVFVVAAVAAVLAGVLGFGLPGNPILLVVGLAISCGAFAALALWTAAWTRNAEAAQLTSAPVLLLAMAGTARAAFPEDAQPWLDLLPGAALEDLVRVAWFGLEPGISGTETIAWSATWAEALPALGCLVGWTVVGVLLAGRAMRWEPRD